jgi:hypothetical protein
MFAGRSAVSLCPDRGNSKSNFHPLPTNVTCTRLKKTVAVAFVACRCLLRGGAPVPPRLHALTLTPLANIENREFLKLLFLPAGHELTPFGTLIGRKTPAISPYFTWKNGYIWRDYVARIARDDVLFEK